MIIVALGFALGVMANWFVRPAWFKTGLLVVVILATIAGLASVTLIKESLDEVKAGDSDEDVSAQLPTTSAELPVITARTAESTTTERTSSPTEEQRIEETAVEPPPDATLAPQLRYLTDIEPIGGYGNFTSEDSAQLNETVLSESIVFSPGVFNKNLKDLTFNIPAGLDKFEATLGLRDDTLPGYIAHVDIRRRDGSTVANVTLRVGEVHNVTENVGGAGAITIKVSVVEWDPDAVNSRPRIVVGDGRFVPSA